MQNKYQSGSATQISLAIGKTNMNSTAVHQTKHDNLAPKKYKERKCTLWQWNLALAITFQVATEKSAFIFNKKQIWNPLSPLQPTEKKV